MISGSRDVPWPGVHQPLLWAPLEALRGVLPPCPGAEYAPSQTHTRPLHGQRCKTLHWVFYPERRSGHVSKLPEPPSGEQGPESSRVSLSSPEVCVC